MPPTRCEGADANLFPVARFDLMDDAAADAALVEWGHWLGGCNRPFGRQSFGLWVYEELVSVAVSASTVNAHCGGYERQEVVELARLCSHPQHRWATRVCLRLWREIAPRAWPYWPVRVCVSYANAARHKGDIYRFDGWRKQGVSRGGTAGGGWNRRKVMEPKTVWVYELAGGTT